MFTSKVDTRNKIMEIGRLAEALSAQRASGRKIVLCHGVFDLLHPGHLNYFRAAKQEGDVLVVTLTTDRFVGKGPGRPVFKENVRSEFVAALECVDYVALNDLPTAVEAIKLLKPDVYVKGLEYADIEGDVTGGISLEKTAVEEVGGRLHFTDEPINSSTKLLNDFFEVFPEQVRAYLSAFKSRHSADEVIAALARLKQMRVLVIGETIVDEYHYVRPLGKSSKDSLVATSFVDGESFAGGVLAAANHAAGFCGQVEVLTVLGRQDAKEELIRGKMKPNVRQTYFHRDDAPTIVKRRYVDKSFLNKLFEVYYFNDAPLPSSTEQAVADYLEQHLAEYDAVIVTDYGHGFLTPKLITLLTEKSKHLSVNTQTNAANWGFNLVTKYPRADYVCIDEQETRLATAKKHEDVRGLASDLMTKLAANRVMVTRGHHGSLGLEDGVFTETPTLTSKIVDRTGAGDALLAVTAPCVASGMPMDMVGLIGNAVGAIAVSIVGNRSSVEEVALIKYVRTLLK